VTDARQTYRLDDYRARESDLYAAAKFQIVSRYLDATRSLRILNVGCGSGEANLWLAQAGHRVDACDPDEAAVAMSEALKRRHGLDNLTVSRRSIEEVSGQAQYDCVFMLDVLEHLEDDDAALRRAHALLKPGGLGCFSVPALPVLYGHHDVMLGHHRRYTRRSLARAVAPYFETLVLRYFGFFLIPVAFVMSRLLRRPYPIAATDRSTSLRATLGAVLGLEARLAFPLGTSLLFIGRRRTA
jgi:2-polyprenyl-3-methyl-5-hydroxy-6-metoxy-1,4-benzoquinol methylase